MLNPLNEINDYEIKKQKNNFVLYLPINNLIQPKFLIKNQDLIIFSVNYKMAYVIKSIDKDFINLIINGDASVCGTDQVKYKINLIP